MRWLYMELYNNSSMFAELCDNLYCFYKERGSGLKERDLKRVEHPDWYKQNDMLGMMFYIDNFTGNMPGVAVRLMRIISEIVCPGVLLLRDAVSRQGIDIGIWLWIRKCRQRLHLSIRFQAESGVFHFTAILGLT